MNPRTGLLLAAGWLMCACGGVAARAAVVGSPPEPAADTQDRGLLAGPVVSDREAMARGEAFGGARAVPIRRWMLMYHDIELSPEQRRRVGAIQGEWERESKGFAKHHGIELRDLSQRAGQLTEQERARLEQLEAQRPQLEDYQQRFWDVLTPEQQEAFRQRLDRFSADTEQQMRRAEQARARAAAGTLGDPRIAGLDELAARRLQFLRSRQKRQEAN